jgi:hypothetical protein
MRHATLKKILKSYGQGFTFTMRHATLKKILKSYQ